MSDNIRHWIDCWNLAVPPIDQISDTEQADRWNKRSGSFSRDVDDERREKKTAEFFSILGEVGFAPGGSTVLDIGCGPGSLALPLAEAGAVVTAVDISTGMLDRIRETAVERNLSIRTVEGSWWSADIDRLGLRDAFDLVIASFTPGIKDVGTFEKMVACSRKWCYYSGFIRADHAKIPEEIYAVVPGIVPKETYVHTGLVFPFMYLYLQGIHPALRIVHRSEDMELAWPEAAERAIEYLELNQELSDEQRENIRSYYHHSSPDGMYRTHSEVYRGMMAWTTG